MSTNQYEENNALASVSSSGLASHSQHGASRRRKRPPPPHIKYRGNKQLPKEDMSSLDSAACKLRPSMVLSSAVAGLDGSMAEEMSEGGKPRVTEFVDMENHTCQLKSAVDISEPLFQPYPRRVVFSDYKPYSVYEQTIYFRNNDSVPRRLKVAFTNTPFFEISNMRAPGKKKELKDSKVAAGMEVCFIIRFKPQEVTDYACELSVLTEREKFAVEVVAVGERPLLQFPDNVSFDMIPVKSTATKQIIARNIGARGADFTLVCTHPAFDVAPKEGHLDPSSSLPIQLTFTPTSTEAFVADLVVQYHGGQKMFVALEGAAEDVEIVLSEPAVTLDSTYISLSSQRVIRIHNKSEIPVKFCWKNCADEVGEGEERARLHAELLQMWRDEEQRIEDGLQNRTSALQSGLSKSKSKGLFKSIDSGEEEEEEEEDADGLHLPLEVRTAKATIKRKYRQLERALEEDQMLFEDDAFEIRPLRGEIWPGAEALITVIFRPSVSIDYVSRAFLDVVGQERRLPLGMRGHGIGPKAFLSYDVLDIGDVFLGSTHKYEMTIYNKGDISCDWHLVEPEASLGSTFAFSPKVGTLEVHQSARFNVEVSSTVLGEFSEEFQFALRGSNEPLVCQVKGQVLGPSFRFDVESVDFGIVSFDFLNSRTFRLVNTCEIAMGFALRMPQDGAFGKREFELTPSQGTIEPFSEVEVTVDFTSQSAKVYDYFIMVDVDGVGEGIASLPVTADCQVPALKVLQSDMDYGEVFVRFPYDREFTIVNPHPVLSAKYEILPQEEGFLELASFQGMPPVGPVPPNSELKVTVRLISERLGSFRMPMHVGTRGSAEPPMQININATSRGPRVELSSAEIKWGPTDCLKDSARKLKMTNNSAIPAAFKTFIKNTRSVFRIDVRDGVLGPGEAVEFTLTANLDDTVMLRDHLHIIVTEGDNIIVPLSARGAGTTIYCSDSLEMLDFGAQLTNRVCERRLTLENRGRRKQKLRWVNETIATAMEAQNARLKQMEQEAKKRDPSKPFTFRFPDILPQFTVMPTEIELRPWTAVTYIFRGKSEKVGTVVETFVCESMVGKESAYKPVIRTAVKAGFITPLLEMSDTALQFDYTWELDVPLALESKTLTLTNRSALPLTFLLRSTPPFSVDTWEHTLKPGDASTVNVVFDPGYRSDKRSHKVDSKLVVVYSNHPQRDEVTLHAEINYPNLDFEFTQVNFGCVLNDTTKTMLVRVSNPSTVDAAFQWFFVEDEEARAPPSVKKPYIPINQVFDILPIRWRLRPGESEDLEFVFYGHANRKWKGSCVCEVEGGPEYDMTLLGEASTLSFQLDKTFLDFGKVQHARTEERDFFIFNPSKVAFAFKVSLDKVVRQGVVDVAPSAGKVYPGERQRVVVKFAPGIPEVMCEKLLIEVAHFDPVEFPVYGEGVYTGVAVGLPRDAAKALFHWRPASEVPVVDWEGLLEQARKRLTTVDPAMVPMPFDLTPPGSSAAGGGASLTGRSARSSARSSGRRGSVELRTQRQQSLTSRSSFSASLTNRSGGGGVTGRGSVMGSLTGTPPADPLSLMPERVIRPVDVEMEANRLVYIRYLEDLQRALRYATVESAEEQDANNGGLGVPKLEIPKVGKPAIEAGALPLVTGGKRGKGKGQPPFVVAYHTLDFGNVVSGSVKTLKFKVTNPAASGSLTWVFQRAALGDSGFSISPEKVSRLPEGASAEFEVTLNAKGGIALGRKEVPLPIEVKDGPATVILLRANICVPEVALNVEALDFGPVYTGWGKTMAFQVHNISPVSAEWEIRRPSGVAKSEDRFSISPMSGSLLPGHRANVTVDFAPADGRGYSMRLQLRVGPSSPNKVLTLLGLGVSTSVRFDPPLVELSPILPNETTEREVTMVNDTDRAIDVYSVDWDDQFVQEEAVLRAASGFGTDATMRIVPRNPGEGLPPALLEEFERSAHPPPDDALPAEEEGLIDPPGDKEHDATVREEGKAVDLLLVGAPLSGCSTLASALKAGLSLPYPILRINDVIQTVLGYRGVVPAELRRALGKATPLEQQRLEARLSGLREQLGVKKAALEAVLKSKPKGKAKATQEPPEMLEVQRLEKEIAEAAGGKGLTVELLKDVLQLRLSQPDAARGCVVDGLECDYLPQGGVAEALQGACKNLATFHLDVSKAEYGARLLRMDQEAAVVVEAYEKQEMERQLHQGEGSLAEEGEDEDEDGPVTPTRSIPRSQRSNVSSSVVAHKPQPAGPPPVTAEAYEQATALRAAIAPLLDPTSKDPAGRAATFFAELSAILARLTPPPPPEQPDVPQAEPVAEGQEGGEEPAAAAPTPVLPAYPALVTLATTVAQTLEDTLKALLAAVPPPLVPIPGPLDLDIPKPKTYMLLTRPGARPSRKANKSCFSISRTDTGKKPFRWILEPHASTTLKLSFTSPEVGRVESMLRFEAVGGTSTFALACLATAAVPTINNDPRNVYMRRVKARAPDAPPVSKRFVTSREVYDFGPLLLWKDPAAVQHPRDSEAWKAVYATNGETLRLTNNGHFPVKASLSFEGTSGGVFSVEPAALTLAEGETAEVTVWAFPKKAEACEDALLVSLVDNPTPYRFPLTALGALPSVSLKGQWFEKAQAQRDLAASLPDDPPPPAVVEDKKKPAGKKNSIAAPPPPLGPKAAALAKAKELEESAVVDFDRLLVGKVEVQEFRVVNTSQVPVTWKLDTAGMSAIEEFRISPAEGMIGVGQQTAIAVVFNTVKEAVLQGEVAVLFSDVEGGLAEGSNRVVRMPVKLLGEGYNVHFVPFDRSSVDFGNVRAGESKEEIVRLSNTGKYDYAYAFEIRKASVREVFAVEPAKGVIPPGGTAEVKVTFGSKRTVAVRDSKEIRCKVSEPKTGEVVEELVLQVSARSVFSAFRVQPSRGLNFGALRYNDAPRSKRFDIRNEGLFAFTFAVTAPLPNAEAEAALLASTPTTGTKAIGHFSVSQCGGVVEPGQTAAVDVTFAPSGLASYKELVQVLISGADPSDPAVAVAKSYELAVDSCYPGIVTTDFRSVFEEQLVVEAMDEYPGERGGDVLGKVLDGSFFCVEDKTLNFGAIVCSSHPKGVVERVKITNPFKVNAVVTFDVTDPSAPAPPPDPPAKPAGKEKAGKKGAKEEAAPAPAAPKEFVFSVQPKTWDIPPHEHRFVSVYFNPREMAAYRGLLVAKVADAKDASTGELSVSLTGAGTLPCVTVLGPKERTPQGAVVLDLGQVQVHKAKSAALTLANHGVVAVTVLMEAPDLPAGLHVPHANGSLTLQPGQTRALQLGFRPRAGGSLATTLKLRVLNNPYEATAVDVTAQAYERDVILEGLGDETVDTLTFPELNLGDEAQVEAGTQVCFAMRNTSASRIKFRWPSHPSVSFSPARGHIPAGGRKEIVARFKAANPESLSNVPISFSTQRIALPADGVGVDWDDTHKVVRPGTVEEVERIRNPPKPVVEAAKPPAKGKAKEVEKPPPEPEPPSMWLGGVAPGGEQLVVVVVPEPPHEAVGQPAEQPLLVSGVADRPRYECDERALAFKSTAMYQARVATLVLRNVSNTHLPFDLTLTEARPLGLPRPAGEAIPNPFSAEPASGSIPPRGTQELVVRFEPLEVDTFHYALGVNMPSLGASVEPLRIALSGAAFRPACHFDVDDSSEYLSRRSSSQRNEKGQFGPIEASSLRVVELSSVGVHTRNVKRFLVMNTTSASFDFTWEVQGVPSAAWKCLTPKGTIMAGKRGEVGFEFTPESTETAETFFCFRIQGQKDEELFLFVGSVTEPRVSLDRVRVEMNAAILGTACTDTVHIVNQEDVPFSFSFDKKLLSGGEGANRRPVLEIVPMSGMVPPRGRMPITVTLRPDEEKRYNFNLACAVRRKPAKLSLNLKGEGYLVHSRILVAESTESGEAKGSDADAKELLLKPAANVLDFGAVHLNEKAVRLLSIVNTGRFNFDYHLNVATAPHHRLTIGGAKLSGSVRKNERVQFKLEFHPLKETSLEGASVKVSIAGKYDYEARLAGVGERPNVTFSFRSHDFGPCFVSAPGLPPVVERAVLRLINNDPLTTFSVDSGFDKSRVLDVQLQPTMLEPGAVLDVPVLFTPRAVEVYDLTVPFVINGTTVVKVRVVGQGIAPQLELGDPSKAMVAFGQINEGQQASRTVTLCNRSKKALLFELVDAQGLGTGRLDDVGVLVAPRFPMLLGPRESTPLDLTFAPRHRVLPFVEDVQVKFLGQVKKLLSVSGQCVGFDISLEADAINFGTVCIGSSRTRRLQLANNGEMASRFRWEARTFGPHISVTPLEGVLQPFSELCFEVTFAPTAADDDIRIEGVKLLCEGVGPLAVTCTGACVALPTKNVSLVQFAGKARREETKGVSLANPTDKPWYLTPVLRGAHWKVADQVVVPPKGSVEAKITYWPQFMTDIGGEARPPLTGSLFFALPNGDALLFNLQGRATEPLPQPTVAATTPAKRALLVNLPVENWLGVGQKFAVEVTPVQQDPSVQLSGVQMLEVPAYATKEYVLRVYACKEGRVGASVRFTNPANGEFVLFNVQVDVSEPEVIDTIEMEAPVRQTARTLIMVENPLPKDMAVTFGEKWWSSTSSHVRLSPVGSISGNSEGVFELEYRPLVPTDRSGQPQEFALSFECAELGKYKYRLRLKAAPPASNPTLQVETPLGSSQVQTFAFRVYNTSAVKLECKVQKPLFFTVAPSLDLPACGWEGQEVKVTVTFEPEGVSAVSDVLTISAGAFGTYVCNLRGNAKPPVPQGPIRFNPGEGKEVVFRNVFQEATEFSLVVDSPVFVLAKASDTVPPKTSRGVMVTYQADPKNPGPPVSAKLIVAAKSKPQLPPWVYYLQGS